MTAKLLVALVFVLLASLLFSLGEAQRLIRIAGTNCPLNAKFDETRSTFMLSSGDPCVDVMVDRLDVDLGVNDTYAVASVYYSQFSSTNNETSGIYIHPNGDVAVMNPDLLQRRWPVTRSYDQLLLINDDPSLETSYDFSSLVPRAQCESYFSFVEGNTLGTTMFVSDSYYGRIIAVETSDANSARVFCQNNLLGVPISGPNGRPPFGISGLAYLAADPNDFMLGCVIGGTSPFKGGHVSPNLLKINVLDSSGTPTPGDITAVTANRGNYSRYFPGNPVDIAFLFDQAFMVDFYSRRTLQMTSQDQWVTADIDMMFPSNQRGGTAKSITIDERGHFWVLVNDIYKIYGKHNHIKFNCDSDCVYLESGNWQIPSPSPFPSPSPSPSPLPSPVPGQSPSPTPSVSPSPSPFPSPSPSPSPIPVPSPVPSPFPSPSPIPSPSPTPLIPFNFEFCDGVTETDCFPDGTYTGLDEIPANVSSGGDDSEDFSVSVQKVFIFTPDDEFSAADYDGRVRAQLIFPDPSGENRRCVITSDLGWYEQYLSPDELYCYLRMDIRELCDTTDGPDDLCNFILEDTDYCGPFLHQNYLIRWGEPLDSNVDDDLCSSFTWGPDTDRVDYFLSGSTLTVNMMVGFLAVVLAFVL